MYAPDPGPRGAVHTGMLVGGAVVAGLLLERRRPLARHRRRDLGRARWGVPRTRGPRRRRPARRRPPARGAPTADPPRRSRHHALAEGEIARAVVESVAENTSDAVVAPLVLGALARGPRTARLPRRQHPRRDGRSPQRAVLRVRLGLRPTRRRAQPPRLAPHRPARCAARARLRATRSPPGPGTPRPIPARTPARSRPPSPARWASGWAGRTPTATGSSTAPSSAPAGPPNPATSQRALDLARRVDVAAALIAVLVAVLVTGTRGRSSRITT